VLVVGVGGGFDILNALYFDASEVTGVEINAATVAILTRTYRDYFEAWVSDPRVRLVQAEGRHHLEGTDARFDVLQLSGVDSYSGTAGAAHVFSENYLYTSEAFDLYLSRLSDDGILNLMRLEYQPEREMLRALTTAVAALRRAGVESPADHVIALTSRERNFTALLVKRTPFKNAEVARVLAWANPSPHLWVAAAPGYRPPGPSRYQAFLDLRDPRREATFIHTYPWDVAPISDDRPFFFKYSFWSHVFTRDPVIRMTVPTLEYSLLLLLALVSLAAVAASTPPCAT
jgi:hypothetical protein